MKLHLGCGKVYIPGFIHVDVIPYKHIDYVRSVDDLDNFENNSIELIYASHILEHFKRNEVLDTLDEWYRILKIDGTLRIAVPDFEKAVRVYQKNKDIDEILGLLMGGQTYDYNFHHIVFDFEYLKKQLEKVGFKNIKRYDWRKTIHKDYDDYSQAYLPHMDKENGTLMSLNVECQK